MLHDELKAVVARYTTLQMPVPLVVLTELVKKYEPESEGE